MQDITRLSVSAKAEIAEYIKQDTLDAVNRRVTPAMIRDSFYTRHGKRMLDFIVALALFLLCVPFNLVIAIVTFFDVGRPILFRQSRIGMGEQPFVIYKFRNMTNATDANGELLPPRERVTKWGRFVRKTSLDELLNFVSILKGDMSLIGPRPLMDYYCDRLHVRHRAIYAVRPGLECPPLHPMGHTMNWQERLDNYVWYAENCSLWVDLRLAVRVVQSALDRKSTAARSGAEHGGLMGYDLQGNVIYTKQVPDSYVEQYLRAHGFRSLEEAISAREAG